MSGFPPPCQRWDRWSGVTWSRAGEPVRLPGRAHLGLGQPVGLQPWLLLHEAREAKDWWWPLWPLWPPSPPSRPPGPLLGPGHTHTLPHASTACQRSSWQPLPPDEKPRNYQILSLLCDLDSETNAFSCSCHKNGCSCRIQTGLDCTSRLLPSPWKQIRDVKSPFLPRSRMP